MTQAARKPEPDASRAMPAIGHALRGRMGGLAAAGARTPLRGREAWMSAGWRASAFVLGLGRRYSRIRMGAPWPEQVVAAAGMPAAVNAPQQHWHLAYAPRVTLQLAACDRAAPAAVPPQARVPVSERIVQRDGPRFVSTLIERVLNRSERIDALKIVERAATTIVRRESSEPVAAEQGAATPQIVEGRIQRVLRADKAATIAKTAPAANSTPPQVPTPSRQDASATEPVAPSRSAPQINIEHLADRVVHAIDRRLLAQRERYGRV